jgi:glycosyltransferase involved in cell wall biosynthesis
VTAASGDAEGLPNVVVEAAASGLPVVASDHGGIAEAVIDGQTGFLVPEHDTALLGRRMAELLSSPGLRTAIGKAGRSLAEERFDAARQMRLLEHRYDEARTLSSASETR